ncbi:MAG TPA: amylo-alpha-1,6-glucosidase [Cytophagales bacterium]|nr:amylo-alpha-1,6-glucosidase [Cytophagales bacterium]
MNYLEIENQFYILATSSFADSRTSVIKYGESFGVFDKFGDIHQVGKGTQGLYHQGTRFLSKLQLMIENQRPLMLSSHLSEDNHVSIVDLTNPDYENKEGEIVQHGSIHIQRSKFLWMGVCYEKISFSNFDLQESFFSLSIEFEGDFSDIFEVRGTPRINKGIRFADEIKENTVILKYKGLDDIVRSTHLKFLPQPEEIQENTVKYIVSLKPKERFHLEIAVAFDIDGDLPEIKTYDKALKEIKEESERIRTTTTDLYTSNEHFNEWISRSKSDLITMITKTKEGPYPYAGIPWYSTPFGRDGIITAFECLWLEPEVSKGVLKYLARTQATETNDFQDAEPGKILHEKRGGEMAELGEIPFKLYYGTIDATPLFIVLAGAYYERTGDDETIKELWPNIEKALGWINEYGDIDGDGFVEYATRSSKGLVNQGWKDSHDSIFYSSGELAKAPIALCEVQAYVYEAKLRAGQIAKALGYDEKAIRLLAEADLLKEKFNELFWSEDKETYVLALDGDKKPCNVLTSNAGHCLFSGIATLERAKKVGKSLLSEKMFSGWGVRTLANDERRYNPMSYHNGSIWPHDNAMIAHGFSRYGLKNGVEKVMTAVFETSLYVENQRLPELFCGFERRRGENWTAYPVACSPQAWAVASVFLLLQSSLGLTIKAKEKTLSFYKPTLPLFLSDITIRNLKINDHSIALQIRRIGNEITITLINKDVDLKIEIFG